METELILRDRNEEAQGPARQNGMDSILDPDIKLLLEAVDECRYLAEKAATTETEHDMPLSYSFWWSQLANS